MMFMFGGFSRKDVYPGALSGQRRGGVLGEEKKLVEIDFNYLFVVGKCFSIFSQLH
jgi:hypothetical protein